MKSIAILSVSKLGEQPWRPGSKVSAVAVFGASSIDFRKATMEEGVTKLTALSIFGISKAIVPKGLPVTLSGFSFFGAKRTKQSQTEANMGSPAKELHINAVSIFGAFQVTE